MKKSIRLAENELKHVIVNEVKKYLKESFRGEVGLQSLGKDSEEYLSLQNAKTMRQNNEPPLKIKQTTGWEIGYDGKWRYEGVDGVLIKRPIEEIHTLSDMWKDDDLYRWYPEMKNVKIKINHNRETFTSLDGSYISISINNFWKNNNFEYDSYFGEEDLEQAVQHEIQHVIQKYENWTSGARGPNYMLQFKLDNKIEFCVKRLVEKTKTMTKDEILQLYSNTPKENKEERGVLLGIYSFVCDGYSPEDYLNQEMKDLERIKKEHSEIARNYYTNLGEREAYEVNDRYGWDYDKRRNTLMSQNNIRWQEGNN